jgi:ADP-ribosylglycohydrolase
MASSNVAAQTAQLLKSRADRATGALLGVLVGDGLGFGMQWYYDREEKDKDFGPWIKDMVDPKPDGTHRFASVSKFRHEQGFRAGDISQTAIIFCDLIRSTANKGGFDMSDFTERLDAAFETFGGESLTGRYTDSIWIQMRKHRKEDNVSWDDAERMATDETTGDGAMLAVVLAAALQDPVELAVTAEKLMQPMIKDDFIRGNSIVFALTVQALINGVGIDDLAVTIKSLAFKPEIRKLSPPFDNFLSPGHGAAANQPGLRDIEPKLIGDLFGPDCQLTHLLPGTHFTRNMNNHYFQQIDHAINVLRVVCHGFTLKLKIMCSHCTAAYYYAHRLPNDFEQAVLSASNSGGQNVVRASLTGALLGAMNGQAGIPQRFLDQLRCTDEITPLVHQVAGLSSL